GAPLSNLAVASKGRLPFGKLSWHRDDAAEMFIGDTRDNYPKPDGKYIFDKLSSVFITGNATRDDAPNHIRVRKSVPREIAETWVYMCPAGVYEMQGDRLVVNAPNCIDCKATDVIGPRWTPREGGSGPAYKRM
ncbi:MAG TPA: 4Fe-4S dicluster domain-containing protein, partial [Longimicrobium sp.]|nr:4Fe-4S dicluster domain-containing protein [Longimicrobium sp.]